MPRVLNLGCGVAKIKDAINVDSNEGVHPDLVFQVGTAPIPVEDYSFDEVCFFHCLEHIEKHKHYLVFEDIWRVMKPGAKLYISYPEFESIVYNWLNNTNNDRKFWEATIYGRQLYPGDYHHAAVNTLELRELLENVGFKILKCFTEPTQPFNGVIHAERCEKRTITYEELLNREILNVQPAS